ncbi:MAG: hypothetical protein Devi2KO_32660 [Devosia indica]
MKLFVTIALIGILTAGSGFAHDFTQGSIYLDHPMIEEAPPNAPVLGGYLSIQNMGDTDDRLVAIESSAAEKVEIHRSTVTDGIARMQPMKEGLVIPAGETVWLDNGTHAMFVQPSRSRSSRSRTWRHWISSPAWSTPTRRFGNGSLRHWTMI